MFTRATIFVQSEGDALTAAAWGERIEARPFRPCAVGQSEAGGWEPIPHGLGMSTEAGDWSFARYRLQHRPVPPAAVTEALESRVEEWKERVGDEPPRSQRAELKDEVRADLLRKAAPQSERSWCAWNPKRRLLVTDAKPAMVELVLADLRGSVGPFHVVPAEFGTMMGARLTAWLSEDEPLPDRFELWDRVVMQHHADSANTARLRGHDLADDSVADLCALGLCATELGLRFDIGQPEPLEFVITEGGVLKSLRMPSVVVETDEVDDPAARLRGDLWLRARNLESLIGALEHAIGTLPKVAA